MDDKTKRQFSSILNNWFCENIRSNRSKYSLAFEFIENDTKCIFYSNYPGILIGKAGRCIYDLENRIKEAGFNVELLGIKELGNGYFREIRNNYRENIEKSEPVDDIMTAMTKSAEMVKKLPRYDFSDVGSATEWESEKVSI